MLLKYCSNVRCKQFWPKRYRPSIFNYSPPKILSLIRSFVNCLYWKRYGASKTSLAVYRINIIIWTFCLRHRQRSGGEVGRAQEHFSFEHLGSIIQILLEVVFSYIIIYIFFTFIIWYMTSCKQMHFLTQILGFCRCIKVNWTKLSENDNCLICSMCFTWFTSLIEEYKVSCIHKCRNAFWSQTQYITWEMASPERSRHLKMHMFLKFFDFLCDWKLFTVKYIMVVLYLLLFLI